MTNANFGFNLVGLAVRDLSASAGGGPHRHGHRAGPVPEAGDRRPELLTLPRLLVLPFTSDPGRYSLRHIRRDGAGRNS
ncbi:MAG: hypothetical protein AB1461_10590 [Thermodesulfobacteriota bacterium]